MESQSAAIQASELTKRFGEFTAVDHVSFEVRRGELFGLLGPNGAGKTTLSRMLTTLIVPTSGHGFVAGFDVARDPVRVREAIGVIPQALTSDLDLTGWENVDIYGGFYNLSRSRVALPVGQHPRGVVVLLARPARVLAGAGSAGPHYADPHPAIAGRCPPPMTSYGGEVTSASPLTRSGA